MDHFRQVLRSDMRYLVAHRRSRDEGCARPGGQVTPRLVLRRLIEDHLRSRIEGCSEESEQTTFDCHVTRGYRQNRPIKRNRHAKSFCAEAVHRRTVITSRWLPSLCESNEYPARSFP